MELIVGQVLRPHGIRGELIVRVRTDEPEKRFVVGSVLLTDSTAVRRPADLPSETVDGVRWEVPSTLTIESVRPHLGKLIIAFDGVHDRNLADELRGVLLCVKRADIEPITDPDEFSDHDLVGLIAVSTDGVELGKVRRIEHAPASDLLVLRLPDGRDALVPFVKAIVPEVDVAAGRVVLTPPGGLFDL
jgi:16S rRNA processing protein RimM